MLINPRPKQKNAYEQLGHASLLFALEILLIFKATGEIIMPVAAAAYSALRLAEVVVTIAIGVAHASPLDAEQIISSIADAFAPILFNLWYEGTHTREDWIVTRRELLDFARKARTERRRLKYLWRKVRQAAGHARKVTIRLWRRKAR